jgi:uncharacterized phage-associated protein
MRIDSVEFAKFLISHAQDKHIPLGATKLHKLLYICDGFLLAFDFEPIKEQVKAWNYGPVYPSVHTWMKQNPNGLTEKQVCSAKTQRYLDKINAQSLVNFVLKNYGTWTANTLSAWSHSPGSPWEIALSKHNGLMNCVIDKADMKDYFKQFVKK